MDYDLGKLLPHSRPMILIDRIAAFDPDNKRIAAEVTISRDKIFYDEIIGGMSSLVGIEFMAQTAGCYVHLKSGDDKPKLGFLLGTRVYENNLELFKGGKTYAITACEVFCDNSMASFECFIYDEGGKECASATISAYRPEETEI